MSLSFGNLRSGIPAYASVVFIVLVFGHALWGLPTTMVRSPDPVRALFTELLFSLPAFGYLIGISILRFLVGIEAFFAGLIWLLVPLALHEIEKTPGFWTAWTGVALALVFACLGSFAPGRPIKAKSRVYSI